MLSDVDGPTRPQRVSYTPIEMSHTNPASGMSLANPSLPGNTLDCGARMEPLGFWMRKHSFLANDEPISMAAIARLTNRVLAGYNLIDGSLARILVQSKLSDLTTSERCDVLCAG
jgi:hypothetical protein